MCRSRVLPAFGYLPVRGIALKKVQLKRPFFGLADRGSLARPLTRPSVKASNRTRAVKHECAIPSLRLSGKGRLSRSSRLYALRTP